MRKTFLKALVVVLYLLQVFVACFVACLYFDALSKGGLIAFVVLLGLVILIAQAIAVVGILLAANMWRKNRFCANVQGANFQGVNGQNVNGQGANFQGANGQGANFDGEKTIFGRIFRYKLALIPFYVLNFLLWCIVAVAFLNPFLFMALPIVLALAGGFAFMILLASSSYVIAELLILRSKDIITRKQCIKHILFQLIFVIDVVDTLWLKCKYSDINNV